MATLYVTEFRGLGSAFNDTLQAVHGFPLAEQTVAISGVAASSNPVGPNTTVVRLHTDSVCSVKISAAGTAATTSSMRMTADQTEYFGVNPGADTVSVIANT